MFHFLLLDNIKCHNLTNIMLLCNICSSSWEAAVFKNLLCIRRRDAWVERKEQHILQDPDIPDQWGTGRSLIRRNAISTKPMVLQLVFFDKILLRQDSPFLQKDEPESRLRAPASWVVCHFWTDKLQKEQAGNSYISFCMFVNVFVQLVICGCIWKSGDREEHKVKENKGMKMTTFPGSFRHQKY